MSVLPTAQTSVGDVAETARNWLWAVNVVLCGLLGFGDLRSCHAEPSHRSASVCDGPASRSISPTANASVGVVVTTPRRYGKRPRGLDGIGVTDHDTPSQCTPIGTECVKYWMPTAQTFEVDVALAAMSP